MEKFEEMIKFLDEIILLYPKLLESWRSYRIELDNCLNFKPLSESVQMTPPIPTLDSSQQGYKEKYLKYKQKYLKLKNKMNQ
jgi:hypothetical protein